MDDTRAFLPSGGRHEPGGAVLAYGGQEPAVRTEGSLSDLVAVLNARHLITGFSRNPSHAAPTCHSKELAVRAEGKGMDPVIIVDVADLARWECGNQEGRPPMRVSPDGCCQEPTILTENKI
jgi:hypothetical protein